MERTEAGTTLVEVPQPRRFCWRTADGRRAGDIASRDPIQAIYNYPGEVRSPKQKRLARPGTLPRRA